MVAEEADLLVLVRKRMEKCSYWPVKRQVCSYRSVKGQAYPYWSVKGLLLIDSKPEKVDRLVS